MADKSISNNDTSRQENISNGGRHPDCICMKYIRDVIDVGAALSELPAKVQSNDSFVYSVSAKARGYGIPAR